MLHVKEKKMSSNVYLYHQKLVSKFRQSFIHLDSQLKSYIQFYYNKRRRKHGKEEEEDMMDKKQAVITCLIDQETFSKIYKSILQKPIDQSQYEIEHFRSHCHFQFDLDQSFWKRCWYTFTSKIAMEPNVLSGKRCQGNRVVELWIESIFDHFWITIQHPIEMDRHRSYSPHQRSNRSSVSSSRSSSRSSSAGSSYQYERHKQKVEPMRISLHQNNHGHAKHNRSKKVESVVNDEEDDDDYV